jgi:hypothetical protein
MRLNIKVDLNDLEFDSDFHDDIMYRLRDIVTKEVERQFKANTVVKAYVKGVKDRMVKELPTVGK